MVSRAEPAINNGRRAVTGPAFCCRIEIPDFGRVELRAGTCGHLRDLLRQRFGAALNRLVDIADIRDALVLLVQQRLPPRRSLVGDGFLTVRDFLRQARFSRRRLCRNCGDVVAR
ncbi:hypothetical protein D3C75_703480 [compost metagenome]